MSATPVPFAPETLETIRRAFRFAAERRHDMVTLEHLLRALVEDPRAQVAFTALERRPRPAHPRPRRGARARPHAGARHQGGQARIDDGLRPRRRARGGARRLVERARGRQRQPAGVPAAGGGLARRLLPQEAGREPAAAAQGDRPPGAGRRPRSAHRRGRGIRPEGSAGGLRRGAGGEGPPRPDRPADRPRAGARPRRPGAVPPPQEQPAAGRRARRGQDRAGRGPGAAHRRGPGAGGAGRLEGLRARPRRAGRRHALPRRLRGARQAGAHRARGPAGRDPVHRRDSHAGRRRVGVGRDDGRRQPAEAGAGVGGAALHRLDHLRRREAGLRSRPGAVAALPEDRDPRADRGRGGRDPEGPAGALREAPRRALHRRGAGGGGDAVGPLPQGPAPARQGHRRHRRGRRGDEAAAAARRRGGRRPTRRGRAADRWTSATSRRWSPRWPGRRCRRCRATTAPRCATSTRS